MESYTKKKTVILFVYNGSQYNGSQIQNEHENVRTVEAELQSALFKANCISAENFGFLNKIKWSRSSRTDKGVHALGAIVGLKMLWAPKPYPEIVAEINSFLPEDIQIISLKLVAASFNAKTSSSYREYQYLFPMNLVTKSNEIVKEINQITSFFHGTHSFHNYSRNILPNKPEGKRYIIKFEVESLVNHEQTEYLKFVITGQSFLYHQIRKMIGMTLSVYLGKYQCSDIQKSFSNDKFYVPLAPAEGLCLKRVHFTVYNKKQKHKPVLVTSEEETVINNFFSTKVMPTIHSAFAVFQEWVHMDPSKTEETEVIALEESKDLE